MIKLSVKKKLLLLLFGFLILFISRLLFGYIVYPDGYQTASNNALASMGNFVLDRKNYASKKVAYKSTRQQASNTTVDQKYEKIGSLANISKEFEKSEKVLYRLIKEQELMIQLEQKFGLSESRQLNIALGVIPDKFDDIIEKLKKIGKVKRIQIDKKDKTNEYKKLEAKRVSLQKARESLISLKQSGGTVKDMIELTNRLLIIENQIQGLGVSLGEFDEKNEFCTIKFSLKEARKPIYNKISVTHRLSVALVWAFKIFMGFWIILLLGLAGIWLALVVAAKVLQTEVLMQRRVTSEK